MTMLALETSRLLGAGALTLAYTAMCGWIAWRHRVRGLAEASRRAELQAAPDGAPSWFVAHASQTGNAEELAWKTAQTLHLAGVSVQVCALNDLPHYALAQAAAHLLIIASTYGEGDPPDNAAEFAREFAREMSEPGEGKAMASLPHMPHLPHLRYAVLTLGDKTYDRFCGFGRQVDAWLQERLAMPLFDRIEVDRMDAATIGTWFERLAHLAGASDMPDWEAPAFADWRIAARRQLNPGSPGEPVFHIELVPVDDDLPAWEAGDLAQLMPPAASAKAVSSGLDSQLAPEDRPDHPEHTEHSDDRDQARQTPRDYSVASTPQDGRLHLLMRLRRLPDGTPGAMSGWLGLQAAVGDTVPLRLRAHKAFRITGNEARPLILIGNGTGIAGLRAHIKARAAQLARYGDASSARTSEAAACWLLFGERLAASDHHYQSELQHWRNQGVLARVDAVFSRDPDSPMYVQHRLQEQAELLKEWVHAKGAALYVCGSLTGMAAGVDEVLRTVLGGAAVDELARQGRYRRDVY